MGRSGDGNGLSGGSQTEMILLSSSSNDHSQAKTSGTRLEITRQNDDKNRST